MVRRNHVQTDWWTHYPFDLYNKTCKSKTVDILCVSKSCKERLVDTWPIRPIQQNMQSEDCCYTMCVKIMQKQTLGGHMTHSTHTTKHAIRRLLLYIVYQNHAQNVWRTHDPFDLHTETQKIQSFCGTWCIKVMQKMLVDPLPTRPPQTKCKTQISKVENKPVIGPQPRQEGRARNQARTVVPGVPTQL